MLKKHNLPECHFSFTETTKKPGLSCSSFYCLNGGRCDDVTFPVARCLCTSAYYGTHCQSEYLYINTHPKLYATKRLKQPERHKIQFCGVQIVHFPIRLFYFYLLDYITHRTLILENQKKIKKYKSWKMQPGCDKIVPNVVFIKQ